MIERNFFNISYLSTGSEAQQSAFKVLQKSKILDTLHNYSATLVGTYPIDIAIESSDLDIICEVHEHGQFMAILKKSFSDKIGFEVIQKEIRNEMITICRFDDAGFKFEIFGQDKPVHKQWAYRHMVIEHQLLEKYGAAFKSKVIELKKKGIKTEAAFAILLQLHGDPYEALLQLE